MSKNIEYRAAVIIPVYCETLVKNEVIVLSQMIKVLNKYNLYLVAPEEIEIKNYDTTRLQYVYFREEFFRDVTGYNKLLLSQEFYERFQNYEYILIAQLDTFVISDQIQYWCSKKYDFIGAPWFFEVRDYEYLRPFLPYEHRYNILKFMRHITGRKYLVGNGGFSLRKVTTYLDFIKKNENKIIKYIKKGLLQIEDGITTALHEDAFWTLYVPTIYKEFRVAKYREALKFSFECGPALCYKDNNCKLPFGCHAWEKHDINFWKPVIEKFGYKL